MKKIDKLVLQAFAGPFILTFLVVVFILLMQHMLKYFDDIIGKDLGWSVVGQLLFYFAIFMTPVAMPLAVLLSSLIAFGNLGEHFELTAIKSSGISLLRTLQPIFFFVLVLTGLAFYANNYLVPKAALEAYSLLYDIKQKKPALELREGAFYNGIPDISIKVNKKFPEDEAALKEIIVYDHRKNDGNKEVTIADSGRMSTILNEQYLKFELFNGYNYTEGASQEREMTGQKSAAAETLSRSRFSKTEVVFDLSSYDLKRTDKKWFEGNRIMRNLSELNEDVDSMNIEILQQRFTYYNHRPSHFLYYRKDDSLTLPPAIFSYKAARDSLAKIKDDSIAAQHLSPGDTYARFQDAKSKRNAKSKRKELRKLTDKLKIRKPKPRPRYETYDTAKQIVSTDSAIAKRDSVLAKRVDSVFTLPPSREAVQAATNMARQVKSQVENSNYSVDLYEKELVIFEIQWHKIVASSMACIAMFLIGAPLGSIIKRGGLGVPFLVSILFFIIYYLLSMQGEKLAKQNTLTPWIGVWMADLILLIIGLIFLRQARNDARLFEADFYNVVMDKVKKWALKRRTRKPATV
jgi:lipopolysaccharide export system permease protein